MIYYKALILLYHPSYVWGVMGHLAVHHKALVLLYNPLHSQYNPITLTITHFLSTQQGELIKAAAVEVFKWRQMPWRNSASNPYARTKADRDRNSAPSNALSDNTESGPEVSWCIYYDWHSNSDSAASGVAGSGCGFQGHRYGNYKEVRKNMLAAGYSDGGLILWYCGTASPHVFVDTRPLGTVLNGMDLRRADEHLVSEIRSSKSNQTELTKMIINKQASGTIPRT